MRGGGRGALGLDLLDGGAHDGGARGRAERSPLPPPRHKVLAGSVAWLIFTPPPPEPPFRSRVNRSRVNLSWRKRG